MSKERLKSKIFSEIQKRHNKSETITAKDFTNILNEVVDISIEETKQEAIQDVKDIIKKLIENNPYPKDKLGEPCNRSYDLALDDLEKEIKEKLRAL